MAQKLIKHGTRAGYDAELAAGGPDNICDRCRAAKRVYQKQYTKAGRAKGLHYTAHEVIDHLDTNRQSPSAPRHATPRGSAQTADSRPSDAGTGTADSAEDATPRPAQSQAGPSVADRLREGLFSLRAERIPNTGTTYVESDEDPGYIHPIEPDPEPSGDDWARPHEDEFLVTADGLKQIRDNLGTYLATVGMTLGIIDPYCGTAIRDNLDDMVDGWTRVISHYPTAAKLFMAKGGGKIMAWIDALMATWPVLLAIYEHHLSKSVQLDSLGRPVRVTQTQSESPNGHFATQPQYNYTVD